MCLHHQSTAACTEICSNTYDAGFSFVDCSCKWDHKFIIVINPCNIWIKFINQTLKNNKCVQIKIIQYSPHKQCATYNVQSSVFDGFRWSPAYSLHCVDSLQVIYKGSKLKFWFLLEILAIAKRKSQFLSFLCYMLNFHLNSMNSQMYIKLSRLFHLVSI